MVVVGGMWRGRQLDAPAGRDTRPTSARTREAIASMLAAACGLDLSGASVLDAFAGSGALGIELLSRGAARATFVDCSRQAVACLRSNLARLGVSGSNVLMGDVCKLAERLPGGPFSVVLLDPPYALAPAQTARLVAGLFGAGAIEPDALVLYERASSGHPLDLAALDVPSVPVATRRHGATSVDLMRVAPTEGAR